MTDWCILRTAGRQTLSLAEQLSKDGLLTWAPSMVVRKRTPRKRDVRNVEVAVLPSFVFARAGDLDTLIALENAPTKACPDFAVFRHMDKIPIITDDQLGPLRVFEEREAMRAAMRARKKNRHRYNIPAGSTVQISEGPFGGMMGVVKSGDGKFTAVSFGGWDVKIATFILMEEAVSSGADKAAKAA